MTAEFKLSALEVLARAFCVRTFLMSIFWLVCIGEGSV